MSVGVVMSDSVELSPFESLELELARRRAVAESGARAWSAKELADVAAREAEREWGVAWRAMLDAGFSESELKRAGMRAPGEGAPKRKSGSKRRVSEPAPVSVEPASVDAPSGRRALPVVPDGQEDGELDERWDGSSLDD